MEHAIMLAIDDRPDNLFVIEKVIADYCSGIKIVTTTDAKEGLDIANKFPIDVALIDVQMPDIDGIEMCKRLKANRKTAQIPIILITAHHASSELRIKGLEAGADDFINKPIDNIELVARIKVMLRIKKTEDLLREERDSLEKTVYLRTNQLYNAEKRYRTLFNNVTDAIFILDTQGRILEVNDEACKRLGYDRDQLMNMNLQSFNEPKYNQVITNRLQTIKQEGTLLFETTHIARQGKSIPVEVNAKTIEYDDHECILSVARDISERKEKQKLESHILHMEKMDAIGKLASGIVHDFNNVLSIILGNIELAFDEISEHHPSFDNLENAKIGCYRAKDIIHQLQSFYRKSDELLKPINILPIIKESIKLLRSSIPSTILIKDHIQINTEKILGDPTKLHQVLINLCTNAVHAMEEKGGGLEIRVVCNVFDEQALSNFPDLMAGKYIQLSVHDTGKGISPEIINHIFEPYYTTKEAGKGTGMGLALVKNIIQHHKGVITVKSQVDKGSTFTILLPVLDSQESAQFTTASLLSDTAGGHERILFIDDENYIGILAQQVLEGKGYTVDIYKDPVEAFKAFQLNPDLYDLVITDMTMPKLTGDRLAIEILGIRPHIPIIICTGYSEKLNEQMVNELGISKYIQKPLTKKLLEESVREVLDKSEKKS
ncbi:MAG: response regulator [Desulfobacterales bacterium]|nr:response regulator [Desulfobacterales bacterium]